MRVLLGNREALLGNREALLGKYKRTERMQ